MDEVVIVEACRTAVGKFCGTLKNKSAQDLAEVVINGIIERSHLDPSIIDNVIFGQCRQSSDSSNIARVAALRCGIPESSPGYTVMCACASGMMALSSGTNAINTGMIDAALVGGTESMTNGIFYLSNARFGVGTGNTQLKDSITEAQFCSQPQDIYGRINMGITAENIAKKYNISREDQDEFAYNSQIKAARAIKEGKFRDEIIPITIVDEKKQTSTIFDTDEFPRETSMEKLAKLSSAFIDNGTVTAGNSSGRNDGASALLLMNLNKAKK